jgi:hypothetical protein
MLPNDMSADLVTEIGVTTTPVEVAVALLAAMALPAPKTAKATTASLNPFETKRACLFILVFLKVVR